jgi:hypothetical protein
MSGKSVMYWSSALTSSLQRVGHTDVSQGFTFPGSPQSGPLGLPTWHAAMVGSTG